jgi:translation initiation factor 2D
MSSIFVRDRLTGRYDASHPSIEGHAPYLTISEQGAKEAKKAARENVAADLEKSGMVESSKGKQLAIEELWKPLGPGATFWEICGIECVYLGIVL